jgi:hypothetical protein
VRRICVREKFIPSRSEVTDVRACHYRCRYISLAHCLGVTKGYRGVYLLPQTFLWYLFATPKRVVNFKNIFEVYCLIVYEHRPSIIAIVSEIIMFSDKSNTDNKTVYTPMLQLQNRRPMCGNYIRPLPRIYFCCTSYL